MHFALEKQRSSVWRIHDAMVKLSKGDQADAARKRQGDQGDNFKRIIPENHDGDIRWLWMILNDIEWLWLWCVAKRIQKIWKNGWRLAVGAIPQPNCALSYTLLPCCSLLLLAPCCWHQRCFLGNTSHSMKLLDEAVMTALRNCA